MAKSTISRDDYLKLVGLLTLAKAHNDALDAITAAAVSITGETDAGGDPYVGGHTGDVVWGSRNGSADELLKALQIKVED